MISRVILFIIVLCFYNSVEAQIGAKIKEQEYAICGTWSSSDIPYHMTLIFNQDGSGEFDGGELKYKVEGNKLILTQAGNDVNYSFKVQSNLLRLSDGDLDDPVLFERNSNHELSDFQNEDLPENVDNANFNPPQIKVGKQIWSTENLEVTKFRNGDAIQEAKTNQEWRLACKEGRPAWCYYNNEPLWGKEYGILYNWFAINDPRGLAPAGWHIPSHEEWMTFANLLVGSKLSDTGMENSNNVSLYDSGLKSFRKDDFTSQQGGYRNENGGFQAKGISSNWWSTTEASRYVANFSVLRKWGGKIEGTTGLKICGASVRCVKD